MKQQLPLELKTIVTHFSNIIKADTHYMTSPEKSHRLENFIKYTVICCYILKMSKEKRSFSNVLIVILKTSKKNMSLFLLEYC